MKKKPRPQSSTAGERKKLYTLEYVRPEDGQWFLLEGVSFDPDKTRWTFGYATGAFPHFADYDTCVELLLLAQKTIPNLRITEFDFHPGKRQA